MRARLYTHVLGAEVRRALSYRADFWIQTVAGLVVRFGVAYFLWQAVFRESGRSTIGGYSFEAMLLYYVLVVLLGQFVRGTDHLADVSTDIYEGGLSRYLVYPSHYFGFKYAQHLGNAVTPLLQLALLAVVYIVVFGLPGDVAVSPGSVARTVVLVGVGNVLFYVMHLPIQSVAFWADNVWSLVVMLRFVAGLLGGAHLPLSLFPEWAIDVMRYLPFRYLYDFPVNTLLGRVSGPEWLVGLAVALGWILVLGGLSRLVWRRGTLSYTGVGI